MANCSHIPDIHTRSPPPSPPPFSLTSYAEEAYKKGPVHRFFPPLSKLDPPYPIAPDGILPNSVILQQLRKSEEDRDLAREWQPSVLTDEEIAAMASRKKVHSAYILHVYSFYYSYTVCTVRAKFVYMLCTVSVMFLCVAECVRI